MPIPLIVLLWGLVAIAVITAVGRYARADAAGSRPALDGTARGEQHR